MSLSEIRISIEQLRVGLYIRLDTWMAHPFLFNSFKIRDIRQIEALRACGIHELAYVPAKSNRVSPADSLTPAEALAYMFKHQKAQFDPVLLKLFIRCMGIYPPGSIVQLNNDTLGMVVSVKPDRLLQPTILLYDPAIPKEEAVFIDLDEAPELAIVRTLRPAELSAEVHDYLDPRTRVSYFLERASDRR